MDKSRLVALACALLLGMPTEAREGERRLVAIEALEHDPLFLDAASLRRSGASVSFKYLLDVLAPPEEGREAREWRSNEIEAVIDCRQRTLQVRQLVAYSGPRGSGTATAVHRFTSPGRNPQPIAPGSTFAHLEAHVCRPG